MLKFFSRRKPKGRVDQTDSYRSKEGESLSRKSQKYRPNKSVIVCKIILLDGTDISLDVPVSIIVIFVEYQSPFVKLLSRQHEF